MHNVRIIYPEDDTATLTWTLINKTNYTIEAGKTFKKIGSFLNHLGEEMVVLHERGFMPIVVHSMFVEPLGEENGN
jgi:hypothetical protein